MAFLLGCEKVRVEMPSKVVLRDVSLGVNAGERIGIVGRNGDGKSTLLKLLDGLIEPDEGRVIRTRGVSVGFLGQADQLDDDDTVERAVVGDAPAYEWASDARIRDVLKGLLADIDLATRVGTLSGGQRRRVDLARVLVGEWDVLMLDEPTNHLDISAISWLANHLKHRWRAGAGALLTVTHDRWFLDEVCNTMWEVHAGQVLPFEGGFSAYIMQRVERERLLALAEQKRQNQLRRELAWLSRGARARSTKPKFHVQAAQALIADVPELRNKVELKRMAMARIGKQVVEITHASVVYGDTCVLEDIDWILGPGDRVGIIGGNGAGKTTLLKLIDGTIEPACGRVKIGATVKFAVLSQHLTNLDEFQDERVRQAISRFSRRTMLNGKEMTPASLLEELGFDKADLGEYVRDLSGGQKRRLALMMILLEEPNVLIMDEPGNDLDIDMLAAVEDLLDGWPGTLILVTHDRYLMERVTDMQYALIDGNLRHVPRGVDEYLELMKEREDRAREDVISIPVSVSEDIAPVNAGAPKLSNNELRALKKLVASTEKKMATMQGRIEDAKEAMSKLDQTDYVALTQAEQEVTELEAALAALEEQWLEASEALEGQA